MWFSKRHCLCFDIRTAVMLVAMISFIFSCFNVATSCKVLSQVHPDSVQVVFITISTQHINLDTFHVYIIFTYIKLSFYIFNLLTSTSLLICTVKNLYAKATFSHIWIAMSFVVLIYTTVECSYTVAHMKDSFTKFIISIALVITILVKLYFIFIVLSCTLYNRQNKNAVVKVEMRKKEGSSEVICYEVFHSGEAEHGDAV